MKKNKGITLIALVVTIIILLILAGVSISLIAGGDGILGKAQSALEQNNIAEAKEQVAVKIAEYQTDYYEAVYVDKEVSVSTKLGDWIAAKCAEEGGAIKVGNYEFTVTTDADGNYTITIFGEGRLKENIVGTMSKDGKVTWPETTVGGGSGGSGDSGEDEPEVTPDTTAPSVPTSLELTEESGSITAVASGSTDDVDSEVTYEYSIDNTNFQASGIFANVISGKTYTVYARVKDSTGNVSEVKESSITIEFKEIAVNTEVTGKNATINGNTATTTNPVIPVGFRAVETTDATWEDSDSDGNPDGWNNGLVIEDEDENQFVWVPVDGTTIEYAKNFTYKSAYDSSESNTSDATDALPTDASGNAISETSQITNYGGFYVGRYEAGVPANQTDIDGTFGNGETSKSDVDGTPVVQKGAKVWTYISYNKAMPNAKSLYANSSSVRSGLLTGTQWDTMCAWIQSETDSDGNVIHDVTNSVSWGNYSNTTENAQYDTDGTTKISGTRQTAGKSEYWKAKNIYDVAGNTYEWTGEYYLSGRIYRGGNYYDGGSSYPASYRCNNTLTNTSGNISFRLVLYVM